MQNFVRRIAILAFISITVVRAEAQLFSGPAFYSVQPYSQMGTFTHFLAINNMSFGMMVAGQIHVNVPAGVSTGTLLRYQVKRPLNLSFGSQWMNLTTYLVGFSQPPAGGTYSLTTGYCKTYLEISGQPSNINLSLVNGAATWNVNMPGQLFNYVSGTDAFLVQDFELDGSRLSGPAGTWIVDLPVESTMQPVPEPASLAVFGLGLLAFKRRKRSAGL